MSVYLREGVREAPMQKQLPTSTMSQPQSNSAAENDPGYPIGYRKPPKHTRFKPGRSGNPKGRPKQHRNVRTIIDETLGQRITIREGNRTRAVTKFQAVVLTMINGA